MLVLCIYLIIIYGDDDDDWSFMVTFVHMVG